MAKLRYWCLWLSDFYGSARVAGLSGTVRRIYLELLAFEARSEGGGLPNDPGLLAKRLGLTLEDFKNAWKEKEDPEGVSQFFDLDPRGRLINLVCEKHLAKDLKKSGLNSKKAQEAARARWDAPSNASSNAPRNAPLRDEGSLDEMNQEKKDHQGVKTLMPAESEENSAALCDAHYEPEFDSNLIKRVRRLAGCGLEKALGRLRAWRQPLLSTLEAWEAFKRSHGEVEATKHSNLYAHPDEVPPAIPRKTDREIREANIDWAAICKENP